MNKPLPINLKKVILLILVPGLISTMLVGCGDDTSYQSDQDSRDPGMVYNPVRQNPTSSDDSPPPKPIPPIGGDNGLYGGCHDSSCH